MDTLPPEAVAALERGRLIEAIKIVRDRTGLDLKSAKELVERYANRIEGQPDGAPAQPVRPAGGSDFSDSEWGRTTAASAAAAASGAQQISSLPSVPAAALAALARGNKVEAVMLTRQATGLGLAAAKRLVESHQNTLVGGFGGMNDAGDFDRPAQAFPRGPMAEPGRVTGDGYKWLPVIIVLLVVALVWMYFGGFTR